MTEQTIFTQFECKEIDSAGEFEGYGSIFGNVDFGGDIVAQGAFKESLAEHEAKGTFPLMLHGHMMEEVGEWLDLKEDNIGLRVRGKLWIDGEHPDPSAIKIRRGMMKKKGAMGLSIGFRTIKDEWDRENETRTLTKVDLMEISPVLFPMNDLARVTDAKSNINTIREFERFLVRVGNYSTVEAKMIASHGFGALGQDGKSAQNEPSEDRDDTDFSGIRSTIDDVSAALASLNQKETP